MTIPQLTMTLPPFDPEAACPRCSAEAVAVTWHAAPVLTREWPCSQPLMRGAGGHICRSCQRCGYAWPEAAADSAGSFPAVLSGETIRDSFERWLYGYLAGDGPTAMPDPLGSGIRQTRGAVWMGDAAAAVTATGQHVRRMLEDAFRAGTAIHQGEAMAIRKTGTATGEVLGTEDQPEGLTRTAASEQPWTAGDEQSLDQENTQADEG